MIKLTPTQKQDRTYALVLEYGTSPNPPKEQKEQIRFLNLYGYTASKNGTPLERLTPNQLRGFAYKVFNDSYRFWNSLTQEQKQATQKRYEHSQELLRQLEIERIRSKLKNPDNIFLASRIVRRFKESPQGLYEKRELLELYNGGLENGINPQRLTSGALSFYSHHVYKNARKVIESLSIPERRVLETTQELEERLKDFWTTRDERIIEGLEERIQIIIEANDLEESSPVVREADRVIGLRQNIGMVFVKRKNPNTQQEIPF